jgi:hypothetical protein
MKAISTALLLATAPAASFAQPANEAVISTLRSCVRENAAIAQNAGIATAEEVIAFFHRSCDAALSAAAARPGVGAFAPGIFRRVIGEEWTALSDRAGPR